LPPCGKDPHYVDIWNLSKRQRGELAEWAFDTLTQSLTKAVGNLVKLLDNKDNRLKRIACKYVIEYILKHKEIEDLENRITAIEQRLSS
jgi:hypothetical protein